MSNIPKQSISIEVPDRLNKELVEYGADKNLTPNMAAKIILEECLKEERKIEVEKENTTRLPIYLPIKVNQELLKIAKKNKTTRRKVAITLISNYLNEVQST
ncbi:hypothetical protein [uncultured Clostridium sp.]|nr:hypothetical protein [uncultured Clostridium sp.]